MLTPLANAVSRNLINKVDWLLNQGADMYAGKFYFSDLTIFSDPENNIIYTCIKNDNFKLARKFLAEKHYDITKLSTEAIQKNLYELCSIICSESQVLLDLLARLLPLNPYVMQNGWSLLHMACNVQADNSQCVKLLLSNGYADKILVSSTNKQLVTSLVSSHDNNIYISATCG
jgi:hypothetical protein